MLHLLTYNTLNGHHQPVRAAAYRLQSICFPLLVLNVPRELAPGRSDDGAALGTAGRSLDGDGEAREAPAQRAMGIYEAGEYDSEADAASSDSEDSSGDEEVGGARRQHHLP